MAYRTSSKFHKIRTLKTDTGINNSVTITQYAADKFRDFKLYEVLVTDGILLLKSGCDMFENRDKIVSALNL